MKNWFILWTMLCVVSSNAQDIFTGISGGDLLDNLSTAYKPVEELLSYGDTRDLMYSEVYKDEEGYVTCFYTESRIFLPDGPDPSTFLYRDGADDGMTAEHIYPQSKGAKYGNAKVDMHCLVPAIWRANEGRSNYPFAEIDDEDTDHWYHGDEDLRTIPDSELDKYSEQQNGGWGRPGKFEPREAIKGDIARAVFYFYTMYNEEAMEADDAYFHSMLPTLLVWHEMDPADEAEIALTYRRATFQEDKPNPYVLDCSLAYRSFGDPDKICAGVSNIDHTQRHDSTVTISPNPAVDVIELSTDNVIEKVVIINQQGQRLRSVTSNTNRISVSDLEAGYYTLQLFDKTGFFSAVRFAKI